MDLVIIVILIGIVVFFFKQFSSFVYFVAIIDLFFRLLHMIASNLKIAEFINFVNKYIPASMRPSRRASFCRGGAGIQPENP